MKSFATQSLRIQSRSIQSLTTRCFGIHFGRRYFGVNPLPARPAASRILLLTVCLACGLGLGGSRAQAAQTGTTPVGAQTKLPDSAPGQPLLGPDDVVEITVRNHSELDHVLTVLPDGKITFPTVGEMQAAGKTPRALAADIQAELEKTLNNVGVTVVVKESHSRRVRIIGAVKQAGGLDMKPGWRIFDALIAAGGLSARPELVVGRLVRGNGADTQVLNIDVAQILSAPTGSANVALEPNDLLLLDEQAVVKRQAQVIGQVGKPSLYDIDADTSLLALLALAGNPTEHAALSRVYVLRNGKQIGVDLYPLLSDGKSDDSVTKFKMQANDVLVVPTIEKHYSVQGTVSKTGTYAFPEKGSVTVLEALNQAGGATGGDLSNTGVIRMVDGQYTVTHINVDKMLKKGDLSKNVVLQPGDMVYVPPKSTGQGFSWNNLLAPLSVLGVLGLHL